MSGSLPAGGNFIQVQGTPNNNHQGLSKYSSAIVSHQPGDHQSSVNFEREDIELLAGGEKVKLPEIGSGLSYSTEMPEGF